MHNAFKKLLPVKSVDLSMVCGTAFIAMRGYVREHNDEYIGALVVECCDRITLRGLICHYWNVQNSAIRQFMLTRFWLVGPWFFK